MRTVLFDQMLRGVCTTSVCDIRSKGRASFFQTAGKNAEAESCLGEVSDVCEIPPLYIFNGDANELDPRIRGKSLTRDIT